MTDVKITTYLSGSSFEDKVLEKQRLITEFKDNVSKEFNSIFKTDEEKATANIALEVSSRLMLELYKDELKHGR